MSTLDLYIKFSLPSPPFTYSFVFSFPFILPLDCLLLFGVYVLYEFTYVCLMFCIIVSVSTLDLLFSLYHFLTWVSLFLLYFPPP